MLKSHPLGRNTVNQSVVIMISTVLIMALGLTFLTLATATQEVMAQPHPRDLHGAGGHYKFGTISSLQLDKSGRPEWVLSGHWKSNLLNISSTTNSSSNQTNSYNTPEFDTSIRMVMINGSAPHTHTITNYKLLKVSSPDKNTKEFNGTVTISLKSGPVTDVPISIKFAGNNIISVWLDPTKVNNHFGNTPIYGTIFNPFNMSPPPFIQHRGP